MDSLFNNGPAAGDPQAGLILACATTAPTAARTARACECLAQVSDFDRLLRVANAHIVFPLVYRYLTAECGAQLPAAAEAILRSQYQLNVLRNRHLTAELLRHTRALRSAGVEVVSFKGPVLAAMAYGSIELRQFGDLDFLIASADLAKVADTLTAAGYRSHLKRREGIDGGYFQEFEECFRGRDGLGAIDVHWKLMPKSYPFVPAEDDVRARAISFPLAESSVTAMAPADHFIYLCVHGAKHGWRRLGWIVDIAEMLAVPGLVDVEAALAEAGRLGCRRMVVLALHLAHLVGARTPQPVRDAQLEPAVVSIGARVMRDLFRDPDGPEALFEPWVVPLTAIGGVRGRARYVVRRLLAPSMGDFESLPLPQSLYPLYWAIRPLRMTVQYGPRLLGGAWSSLSAAMNGHGKSISRARERSQ